MTTTTPTGKVALAIGRRFKGVFDNATDAQIKFCQLRDESGEGGSTFPDGSVVDAAGKRFRISYNGRLWAGTKYLADAEPVAEAPKQAIATPQPARHTVYCRSFAITARFPYDDDGVRRANFFMFGNPGHGVLDIADGWVILSDLNDKGIEVERETSPT